MGKKYIRNTQEINNNIQKKLNELAKIREDIGKLYGKASEIEQELVKEYFKARAREIVLNDNPNVKAVLEKHANALIDYDRMKELYPDIYIQGLEQVWSSKKALETLSNTLVFDVIRDCMVKNPKYAIKYLKNKQHKESDSK